LRKIDRTRREREHGSRFRWYLRRFDPWRANIAHRTKRCSASRETRSTGVHKCRSPRPPTARAKSHRQVGYPEGTRRARSAPSVLPPAEKPTRSFAFRSAEEYVRRPFIRMTPDVREISVARKHGAQPRRTSRLNEKTVRRQDCRGRNDAFGATCVARRRIPPRSPSRVDSSGVGC
jgi:hypothetical protein